MIPLHSSIINPANATATRNLVLVRKTIKARHGGSLDCADFQVVPLGSNIVGKDIQKRVCRNGGRRESSTKEDYRNVVARFGDGCALRSQGFKEGFRSQYSATAPRC